MCYRGVPWPAKVQRPARSTVLAGLRSNPLRTPLKHPVRWLAAIVVTALCAGEVALRQAGYGKRLITESSARFGWVRLPNQQFTSALGQLVRINSLGYRARDWQAPGSAEQEASLLRIAIVGNSVGSPVKVMPEESFPRLLEEGLQERLGQRPVLVMNFSSPGYTIEQCARVYQDHIRPFRPDVVVILVNAHSPRPMVEAEDPRRFPLRSSLQRTAYFDYYERHWVRWETPGTVHPEAIRDAHHRARAYEAQRLGELIREKPFSPECAGLWEAMEERMATVANDLEERHGVLILAHVPRITRLAKQEPGKLHGTATRLGQWAGRVTGGKFLDLTPHMQRGCGELLAEVRDTGRDPRVIWRRVLNSGAGLELLHSGQTPFFFDDPEHLTPLGHEVIAAGLLEYFGSWLRAMR